MSELKITELDFQGIKDNLRNFLKEQEEFTDYNFEGSGLSTLIDLLAYNTHYNGVLAHLLANEMFLDTAVKRNSVVSIAKTLGYIPSSVRSAKAEIALTITPDPDFEESSFTVTRDNIFTANVAGKSHTFYPDRDYTVSLTGGVFEFTSLTLIEGRRLTQQFEVTNDLVSGPFVIANENVDASTIRVRVQESISIPTLTTWTVENNVLDISDTSQVYFVEENAQGLTQIYFGDDIFGKKLTVGNIVYIDYILSSGLDGNYASAFQASSIFTGSGETRSITTLATSSGGAVKENRDSIRIQAPKYNATRNRVVTANDYKTLIAKEYSGINSISVWGGEDNDPPIYGKVFVCLEPNEGTVITNDVKTRILNEIINPRSIVSVSTEFVEPEYIYITLTITAKYDPKTTTLNQTQISSLINENVVSFFDNKLNRLRKNFYYSQLVDNIMTNVSSVTSVSSQVRVHKRFTGLETFGRSTFLKTSFNVALRQNTFYSSKFSTTISGVNYNNVRIHDTPESYTEKDVVNIHANTGRLDLFNLADDVAIVTGIGTINYLTGEINIPDFYVRELLGGATDFRLYADVDNPSGDIETTVVRQSSVSTSPVVALPSKNTVLRLDTSGLNNVAGYFRGTSITSIPQLKDE